MIHLPSDPPSDSIQAALQAFSTELLPETAERLEQIRHARALWDSKTKAGAAVFEGVRDWLKKLSAPHLGCQYCEYGEPKDIEHIYPKSHFPRLTFTWHNYLLSCKQCNTGHKLAKFAVFDDEGNVHRLRQNLEPISQAGVFIHPRVENPNRLVVVELTSFQFLILDKEGSRNYEKAKFTLETLELNLRDWLLEARKTTYQSLLNSFRLMIFHLELPTIDALKAKIVEPDFDWDRSLAQIREGFIQSCRAEISNHHHRSVWTAIKLQHSEYPAWKHIFEQLPEALEW